MRFSASMLKTWQECQLQAHFKDILDIKEPQHAKTTFGTCIHDALELYNNTGDVEAAVKRFKDTWDDPAILSAEIDVWPPKTTWGELNQRGMDFIRKFHDENRWEKRNIVAVEHRFLVPFGEHTLSGIVDYLEIVGSGKKKELRVVDLKTSAYVPNHQELRFNIQFTIYMYATQQPEFWEKIPNGEELFESLSDVPRRGVWYAVWHNKTLDVGPREDVDLMRLYRVLEEVQRAVELDVHVPQISGKNCIWCAYTNLCAATIPLEHEVHIARQARLK